MHDVSIHNIMFTKYSSIVSNCTVTEQNFFYLAFFLHFLCSHADIYYNFESLFFAENRLVALLQHNYHRICDFDMSILKLLFVYV